MQPYCRHQHWRRREPLQRDQPWRRRKLTVVTNVPVAANLIMTIPLAVAVYFAVVTYPAVTPSSPLPVVSIETPAVNWQQ